MTIIWKLIITGIILFMLFVVAFLGWRVLRLMERVKLLQVDRNGALEIYNETVEKNQKLSNIIREKGIHIDKLKKGNFNISDVEKRIILNALNMGEFKDWIERPVTSFYTRKTYKALKKKLKKNLD